MRWPPLSLAIAGTVATAVAWGGAQPAKAAEPASGSFPAGDGAALTQKICTHCHGAAVIIGRHFDAASAEHYWRTMVGPDPNTVEARAVIAYLSTVLGDDDNDGPDSVLR
jgi:mono/diheme cytochrome c family protein